MPDDPTELHAIPTSVWKLTVKRAKVLTPLVETGQCTVQKIEVAGRRLRISRAMVYRLLARFRQSQETSVLLPTKPGPKLGSNELKPAQGSGGDHRFSDSTVLSFKAKAVSCSAASSHCARMFSGRRTKPFLQSGQDSRRLNFSPRCG
jgi:hypothetical protein